MKTISEMKNLFELFQIAVKTCSSEMTRNDSVRFIERVRSEVVDLEGHDKKIENDIFRWRLNCTQERPLYAPTGTLTSTTSALCSGLAAELKMSRNTFSLVIIDFLVSPH